MSPTQEAAAGSAVEVRAAAEEAQVAKAVGVAGLGAGAAMAAVSAVLEVTAGWEAGSAVGFG